MCGRAKTGGKVRQFVGAVQPSGKWMTIADDAAGRRARMIDPDGGRKRE
jgi:YD repeat-containing protein